MKKSLLAKYVFGLILLLFGNQCSARQAKIYNLTDKDVTIRLICDCKSDTAQLRIPAKQSIEYQHATCYSRSCNTGHVDFYHWDDNAKHFDNVGDNPTGWGADLKIGLGQFYSGDDIDLYTTDDNPRKLKMAAYSDNYKIINSTGVPLVIRQICHGTSGDRFIRVRPNTDKNSYASCWDGSASRHFDFYAWDDNGKYFTNANGSLGDLSETKTIELYHEDVPQQKLGSFVTIPAQKLLKMRIK